LSPEIIGLAGIAQPILQFGFGLPSMTFGEQQVFLPAWTSPLWVVVGVLWILLTMHAAKFVGRLHGSLAKALLIRD